MVVSAVAILSIASRPAKAQGRPDPAVLIAAQQKAMLSLSAMDRVWRGAASTILGNGQKHDVTQTERVGPFLDGSVKVVGNTDWPSAGAIPSN